MTPEEEEVLYIEDCSTVVETEEADGVCIVNVGALKVRGTQLKLVDVCSGSTTVAMEQRGIATHVEDGKFKKV